MGRVFGYENIKRTVAQTRKNGTKKIDWSCYKPHQGTREQQRRQRQMERQAAKE